MASNGIYLAGPVEQDDNAATWRDEIKARHPDVEFIDPMDWQDEWEQDPKLCIAKELSVCERHPILACNIGRDAPRTVGTHHEIAHALAHGNDRIAVVACGELPGFIEHRDVMHFDDVDEAVKSLVTLGGVAADGGTASVGDAWDRKARENIERWGVQHPETVLAAITEEIGEVSQAYLEATYEGGDPERVHGEVDDLGALLLQLVQAVEHHPDAYDPLGTVLVGEEGRR